MAFQFRRGSQTERIGFTPAVGEPIWATDTNELWVGDGITVGGIPITYGVGGYDLQGSSDGPFQPALTVTRTGGTTTVTTEESNGLANGDLVEMEGASDDTLNGTFTVTSVTSVSFSFTQSGELDSSSTTSVWRKVTSNFPDGAFMRWTDATEEFYVDTITADACSDIDYGVSGPAADALLAWNDTEARWEPTTDYIKLSTLKNELGAATDFADFQTRILGLSAP